MPDNSGQLYTVHYLSYTAYSSPNATKSRMKVEHMTGRNGELVFVRYVTCDMHLNQAMTNVIGCCGLKLIPTLATSQVHLYYTTL